MVLDGALGGGEVRRLVEGSFGEPVGGTVRRLRLEVAVVVVDRLPGIDVEVGRQREVDRLPFLPVVEIGGRLVEDQVDPGCQRRGERLGARLGPDLGGPRGRRVQVVGGDRRVHLGGHGALVVPQLGRCRALGGGRGGGRLRSLLGGRALCEEGHLVLREGTAQVRHRPPRGEE